MMAFQRIQREINQVTEKRNRAADLIVQIIYTDEGNKPVDYSVAIQQLLI